MTIVALPPAEQAYMVAEVRRARYDYLLALHILLLCAAQQNPTEIATVLHAGGHDGGPDAACRRNRTREDLTPCRLSVPMSCGPI
jgi:hypothetical protein